MRGSSLATRLFLSATAWVVVILRHHRLRAVVGLPRRDRARLRPPAQPLSAHPDRRSRNAGRAARPSVPVARRAAVRTAAVRLVLADHPHRHRQGRNARLALAVGQEAAEARGSRRRSDRGRHPARLCRRPRGPEPAHGGTAGRSRRRRQVPGQRRRRRHRDFRRNPQLRLLPRRHLRRARNRAAADHDLPGPLRPGAAETHFRIRSPISAPAAPSGSRANFRSRSRRWRARPMR